MHQKNSDYVGSHHVEGFQDCIRKIDMLKLLTLGMNKPVYALRILPGLAHPKEGPVQLS